MSARRLVFALAVAVLPLSATQAQAPAAPATAGIAGGKAPIEILADEALEWHQEQKAYVARGNAAATRGQVTLKADILTAFYRELPSGGTEIHRLSAEGNVVLQAPDQTAYGERGLYDVERDVAVLNGTGLRFVTPNDVVTARDSLEYWRGQNLAVARGDALAVRGDNRVRADRLVGLLQTGPGGRMALSRIDAQGGVVITTPSDVARGEKGTYDIDRKLALLTGGVKITRGESQLNGTAAEVDLETGISRILSGDGTGGDGKGRVRGLFVPGQQAGEGAKR